ncbi:LysR family transcriptional regulator [Denitromonas iodatirespirans]|uniref:LysR family transcriptional regulator n=1 Tax=Denitromonas iodatirespirans TaxID=2795389 RepID=UPI0021070C97|nr:LysR family transcriptional regulator [Denitromonas iodatirespirans]
MRQLQALVAIAEEGTFSAAASRICLSQPALSLLVKQLEEVLALKLFHRTTRKVELTPAGHELLQTARRVLGEIDEGLSQLHDYADCRRGRVTVAALPSLASGLLAEAVASFRREFPNVRVVIRDGVADAVVASLKTGEADFALGFALPGEDDLVATTLLMDTLVAVARKGLFRATRKELAWADLAKHPLIAMARDTSIRRLTDTAFGQLGLDPLPAYEVSFMTTALALVENGEGNAVLPSSALPTVMPEALQRLALHTPRVQRQICILERKGRQRSPAAAQMIAHLLTLAAEGRGA